MTFNEYVIAAQRTSSTDNAGDKVLNGLMGLCGETGEAMDLLKKFMYQGKPMDEDNLRHLRSECGDINWYCAELMTGICAYTGGSPEDILQENIEKLKKRYPSGFSVDKSEHRAENDI